MGLGDQEVVSARNIGQARAWSLSGAHNVVDGTYVLWNRHTSKSTNTKGVAVSYGLGAFPSSPQLIDVPVHRDTKTDCSSKWTP